jgi:hypothetical protein
MADEQTRPDIVVPAAYAGPLKELKRRWERTNEINNAKCLLMHNEVDICEECQQTIEDTIHDDGVAVDAIALSLDIKCVSVHRTCYGPRKLKAEDLAKGACICGAKIKVEEARP